MALERLDKIISASGLASRKETRELVRLGRITIDGYPAKAADEKINPDTVDLMLDGETVCCKKFRYFLLYKPAGVLSAVEDARQKTVLDLLPLHLQKIGLSPVGRLDKDTTGLLFLTNDGDMAHRIISPKKQVQKVYRAIVEHEPKEGAEAAFEQGILLGDGTQCLPAGLERLGNKVVLVTVCEGKYHQVKRMLASVGAPVLQLHRQSVGGIVLPDSLSPGEWVELDAKEMQNALE